MNEEKPKPEKKRNGGRKPGTGKVVKNSVPVPKTEALDFEGLTHKERLFVEALFDTWFNYTQAAIVAGYSERSAPQIGSENMKKPHIIAAVTRHRERIRLETSDVHALLTKGLVEVITTDINDFLEIKGEGDAQTVHFKPEAMKGGKGKVIESITIGRRGIQIKVQSVAHARDMLAKHVGYYEADNTQRTPQGPQIYLPDNGRDTPPIPPKETPPDNEGEGF